jgi:hypothetical protein
MGLPTALKVAASESESGFMVLIGIVITSGKSGQAGKFKKVFCILNRSSLACGLRGDGA